MPFDVIDTNAAPKAIGTYSQAVRAGDFLFVSGQIPLHPETMELIGADARAQVRQVFDLEAVIRAAGTELGHIVRLAVYLTDLAHFPIVNEVMAECFRPPYPARSAIGVAALPRGALVEMDAIVALK